MHKAFLHYPTMPSSQLLAGKTAIITGGTTGIGRAIALAFIKQGASVAVNHLDLEKDRPHLDSLVAEAAEIKKADPSAGELAHLPGDVRDSTTGTKLVEFALAQFKTGRLDIAVSNAGICTFAGVPRPGQGLVRNDGADEPGRRFLPRPGRRAADGARQSPPGGSIIGISSISALVGGGGQTHYTPTKAGVLSLMQSTAVALGKYNIRCTPCCPGPSRHS